MNKKLFLGIFSVLFLAIWALPTIAQVDTVWVRTYNGPADLSDRPKVLAVDDSSNVYVTGFSDGGGVTFYDYCTIKYKPNGDTAWKRIYDEGFYEEAKDMVIDESGNVYVTGYTIKNWTPPLNFDYCTIKYKSNGDTAWIRKYDRLGTGTSDELAYAIAVDNDYNVYITGVSNGITTIKYDSLGNQLWINTYEDTTLQSKPYDITVDDSGYVYVTGEFYSSTTEDDCITIKYTPDGDTAWVRKYNGTGNTWDYTCVIAVDDSGYVYVTGAAWNMDVNQDYVTIKYKPNGDTAWVRLYNGPSNKLDIAFDLLVDDSLYVYVTGISDDSITESDYATIKYDPNGETVWVKRYNGLGGKSDRALAVAIDKSGNIYVAGEGYTNSVNQTDYTTVKYDSEGNELWAIGYNGTGNVGDVPSDIVIDDSGYVYVTGYAGYIGRSEDWTTIKYWQSNPPLPFSLISPEDGDTLSSAYVNFDWETATDPDSGDIVQYILHLSNSLSFHPDSTVIYDSLLSSEYSKTLTIDGKIYWKVKAYDNRGAMRWSNQTWAFYLVGRGDTNGDGKINISDVIYLINYLFKGGPTPDPLWRGDANCNGQVNVTDVIYLINYLFKNGPPPC